MPEQPYCMKSDAVQQGRDSEVDDAWVAVTALACCLSILHSSLLGVVPLSSLFTGKALRSEQAKPFAQPVVGGGARIQIQAEPREPPS